MWVDLERGCTVEGAYFVLDDPEHKRKSFSYAALPACSEHARSSHAHKRAPSSLFEKLMGNMGWLGEISVQDSGNALFSRTFMWPFVTIDERHGGRPFRR